MQVCTSLQTDNHASTPPLSFYRPDALPATQPTVSKLLLIKLLSMFCFDTAVGWVTKGILPSETFLDLLHGHLKFSGIRSATTTPV